MAEPPVSPAGFTPEYPPPDQPPTGPGYPPNQPSGWQAPGYPPQYPQYQPPAVSSYPPTQPFGWQAPIVPPSPPPRSGSGWAGLIVGVVVVVVIAAAVIGVIGLLRPTSSQSSTGSATAVLGGQIVPPSADPNQGWLEFKSDNVKPDALVVDVHSDYQCPWCGVIERPYGSVFEALVESGDIIYRAHLRTFVGDLIIKNDWSQKAAMAASCADTVGAFFPYNQAAFNNQPQEGAGFTDQQLRSDFAAEAGISGDNLTQFQACYDGEQTRDFVQTMESNNSTSTTINFGVTLTGPVMSTPTIFVNGKTLNINDLITTSPPYDPRLDLTSASLLAELRQTAAS